jgi:CheY-like chemotaxis protein
VAVSVIVVDNDPDFLALAMRICDGLGLEVAATAPDAASAINAAKETKPQAALVDIELPDRDGIELGAELATMPWHPQVVLTSTSGDAYSPVETSKSGVEMPFIPKAELAGDRLRDLLVGE